MSLSTTEFVADTLVDSPVHADEEAEHEEQLVEEEGEEGEEEELEEDEEEKPEEDELAEVEGQYRERGNIDREAI